MTFRLSKRSLNRLDGVHDDLKRVVMRAIEITPNDFTVLEGLRGLARQEQLVAEGASRTMNSRHLTGHAVDLGVLSGRRVSWHWPHYFALAETMKTAAAECGVSVEWGGAWGTCLADYPDPAAASAQYVAERRAIGRLAFIDGPHFQLPWGSYPA